jgi:hypothetical protein
LGFGLWALGFGLWALGFGLWALGFGFQLTANGYQLRAALLHLRKNDHQGVKRQGLDEGESEDEGELDARAGGRIAR